MEVAEDTQNEQLQENELKSLSMDMKSKLSLVKDLKKEGNELYQKGVMFHGHTLGKNTMIECCTKYAKALESIQEIEAMLSGPKMTNIHEEASEKDSETLSVLQELKISIFLNLAAAGLKMDSFDSVLNCCNAVLDIVQVSSPDTSTSDSKSSSLVETEVQDTQNSGDSSRNRSNKNFAKWRCKALFRRAKAYRGLKETEKANEDLRACVHLEPGNKQVRTEYQSLQQERKRVKQAELFRLQTEIGRKKLELKNKKETAKGKKKLDSHAENVEENENVNSIVSQEWVDECDLGYYMKNGSISSNGSFGWGQTVKEVHVFLRIPKSKGAKDVTCEFKRQSITLNISGETNFRFDKRQLYRCITVDECTWELEAPGCLHLVLFKENIPTSETDAEPGQEWWKSVFFEDEQIDVNKCNIGSDMSQLPEKAKREWEKSVWEQQQLSPEEQQKLEKEREIQAEMARKEEERIQNNEKAMKDPNKKALFEMMKEKFPDIPLEFK